MIIDKNDIKLNFFFILYLNAKRRIDIEIQGIFKTSRTLQLRIY